MEEEQLDGEVLAVADGTDDVWVGGWEVKRREGREGRKREEVGNGQCNVRLRNRRYRRGVDRG